MADAFKASHHGFLADVVFGVCMKIVAFDVSSACTGLCVFEDGYLQRDTVSTISPDKKLTMGGKLFYFEQQIKKVIVKHKPDNIILEDIFRGPNIKTFKHLAMFRAIVFKVCFEKLKKDPITFMPSEARRMVGCGIKKEDAFAFVINKYNLTNYVFDNDNDRADAIVLGLAYFSGNKIIKPIKKRKKSKK